MDHFKEKYGVEQCCYSDEVTDLGELQTKLLSSRIDTRWTVWSVPPQDRLQFLVSFNPMFTGRKGAEDHETVLVVDSGELSIFLHCVLHCNEQCLYKYLTLTFVFVSQHGLNTDSGSMTKEAAFDGISE